MLNFRRFRGDFLMAFSSSRLMLKWKAPKRNSLETFLGDERISSVIRWWLRFNHTFGYLNFASFSRDLSLVVLFTGIATALPHSVGCMYVIKLYSSHKRWIYTLPVFLGIIWRSLSFYTGCWIHDTIYFLNLNNPFNNDFNFDVNLFI